MTTDLDILEYLLMVFTACFSFLNFRVLDVPLYAILVYCFVMTMLAKFLHGRR